MFDKFLVYFNSNPWFVKWIFAPSLMLAVMCWLAIKLYKYVSSKKE